MCWLICLPEIQIRGGDNCAKYVSLLSKAISDLSSVTQMSNYRPVIYSKTIFRSGGFIRVVVQMF
jgi:hypothetical protein